MKPLRWIAAMALWAMPVAVWAQTQAEPAQVEVAAAPVSAPAAIRIPAGTVVQVEFAETISSSGSHPGDSFAIRLAEPITVGDRVVVQAGAIGAGEIIDARGARSYGREGKLI